MKSRRRLLGTLQFHAEEIEYLPLYIGRDLIEAVSSGQFGSDAILGDRGEIGEQGLEAVYGEVVLRA